MLTTPCHAAPAGYLLAALESQPGETKDAFVMRTAAVMADFTKRSGFEACGSLATAGDRWSIKVMTSHEPLSCRWSPKDVLPGYTETEESIHTHPRVVGFATREGDSRSRHRSKMSMGTASGGCNFSAHDRETGPGYLVACGRVIDMSGRVLGEYHR